MAESPPTTTCEAHGEATRITCVDCGTPICPKCLVRTEVGNKCEACARPAVDAPARPSRRKRRVWPIAAAVAGVALLAVAGVLLVRGGGDAQDPTELEAVGTWEDAPDLADIRGTTAAVVLPDGRVLAAGGGVGSIPLAATEVLEPGADGWRSTGELNEARRGARAVLLDDGRVLVTGGVAEGRLLASAEILDPEDGSRTPTGDMTVGRVAFTLTALPDGRVLAVGGSTPEGQEGTGGGQSIRPSASAEIYSPETGGWEPVADMSEPRFEHSAAALPDGRILIVGGLGGEPVDGSFQPLASAELFDPAVGGFTTAAALADGRTNHASGVLPDGSVVVVGGLGAGTETARALTSVERYDPSAGRWDQLPPLRQARTGATVSVLSDGRLLVVGGEAVRGGSRRSLATAELLAVDAEAWSSAGRMACPRSEHDAVVTDDGAVLVLAGDAAFPGEPPVAQGCVDRYVPPEGS